MSNPIPTSVREKVNRRDGGRCIRCGCPATNLHHRRRRRENHDGLAHSPANLVTLCGMGNVDGCHGWVHQHPVEARQLGLILRPEEDPLKVPVVSARSGVLHLTSDGEITPGAGRVRVDAAAAVEEDA